MQTFLRLAESCGRNIRRWMTIEEACVAEDGFRFVTPPHHLPGAPAPALPLLRHETSLVPAAWLQESLTTFARTVASFLPGHFAAYARLHHPFHIGGTAPVPPVTWRELAARHGHDLRDMATAAAFAYRGVPNAQAFPGSMPLAVIDVLLEHLGPATRTPELCYFAEWVGFGGSPVPHDLEPLLRLPHREYHLFSGPLAAAHTSYGGIPFHHQSANLWWPADHAWCVATEVDHAWSYVGGPGPCVAAILADPRLDVVATAAAERW